MSCVANNIDFFLLHGVENLKISKCEKLYSVFEFERPMSRTGSNQGEKKS